MDLDHCTSRKRRSMKKLEDNNMKNLSGKDYIDLGLGGLKSGFGGMLIRDDYKDRLVKRYGEDGDNLIIDTAFTPDTGYFETAIIDTRYSNRCIIVEEYATREKAERGHDKYQKLLTGKKIPKSLEDCHGAGIFKTL